MPTFRRTRPSMASPTHARLARSLVTAATAASAAVGLLPAQADAQSLRGSRASIDRMYRQAVAHDLHFYQTSGGVEEAIDRGRFERLSSTADVRLHRVSYPYVTATTKLFVERLGEQYRAECGEPLVVTSALRPDSDQPRNSTERSVHPTGMAIDLRRPTKSRCLKWLRTTLLALEKRGVLEATEERRPPHFHVAIFPSPYGRYVGASAAAQVAEAAVEEEPTRAPARATAVRSTTAKAATARRYEVRRGDTLWHIARRYRTTIAELRAMNGLRSSTLRPGQTLLVPVG